LEEIRWLEGRDEGNGTLGNVQGNHLSAQMEKLNRSIAGGGYIGKPLDKSTSFPVPSPLYHFKKKKKPSIDQGNPLPCSASWTLFIISGQFLFSQDGIYFRVTPVFKENKVLD